LPKELCEDLTGAVVYYHKQSSIPNITMCQGFQRKPKVFNQGSEAFVNGSVHPLFRTVWERGQPLRKAIYLSPFAVAEIKLPGGRQFSMEQSADLVEQIFEPSVAPGVLYRHQWSDHDFVMWDNRQVSHSATDPDESSGRQRLHHRVRLAGSAESNYGPGGIHSYAPSSHLQSAPPALL
jgi:alpha-ketoglutarate-dependent taurine dioxygenase